MKCVILAAGYATRLHPLTDDFPKPLLPVGGKPIIDWLIDDLAATADIDEYIVVTNGRFLAHFRDWKRQKEGSFAKPLTVISDGTMTNASRLGAVRDIDLAVRSLGLEGDIMVMAGDNMLDHSLSGFAAFAEEKGTSCVMCHEERDIARLRKTAVITTDASGLITSYEEKPEEPAGHLAVPPFYIYRNEDILRIPEALSEGSGYDAPGSFAAWLSRRVPMYAYRMPGKRYDIGDLRSYEDAKLIFGGPEDT